MVELINMNINIVTLREQDRESSHKVRLLCMDLEQVSPSLTMPSIDAWLLDNGT